MSKLHTRIIKRLQRPLRNWQAQRGLLQLAHSSADAQQRLLRALHQTIQSSMSADERAWINKIEALRTEVCASNVQITKMYYGGHGRWPDSPEEAKTLGVEKSLPIRHYCGSSKSGWQALLLFHLVRQFCPSVTIELGTCIGFSGSYQAAAMQLNGGGRLVTLEGAEQVAAVAHNHLERLALDNVDVVVGSFQDTLPEVLAAYRAVDYAFIDGHHDERATLRYLDLIYPYLPTTALLVFDDIRWSDGMWRAWAAIESDARIPLTVDVGMMGLCVISPQLLAAGKQRVNVPLP